jgi:hypothetical protein
MAFPEGWLHIKNWERLCHRSDKRLPWICLYTRLLHDRDFLSMDRAMQRDLMFIWLLSRSQSHPGWIPRDNHMVAKLIQGGRHLDLQVFVDRGFLEEKYVLEERRGEERRIEPTPPTPPPPKPRLIGAPKTSTPKKTIPAWIPIEAWQGWVEMRSKIRKPATPRAIELAIGKLEKLRAEGHDPGEVLDQSVLHGWQGLFPIRAGGNGNGKSKEDRFEEFWAEQCRREKLLYGDIGDGKEL